MFILPKPKGIQMKNKTETVGLILLFIGVALLIFTFLSAYWFLIQQTGITAGTNLTAVFGEALAPLIATCIRIMYLGIMAWIGSIFLVRGVEYLKVDRGVGMVTFKVEKGVGIARISEEAVEEEKKKG